MDLPESFGRLPTRGPTKHDTSAKITGPIPRLRLRLYGSKLLISKESLENDYFANTNLVYYFTFFHLITSYEYLCDDQNPVRKL
jgi:hypothetical protein